MDDQFLFPRTDMDGQGESKARKKPELVGQPRLRRPNRRQVLLQPCSLEDLIPVDHEVRTIWAVVERLDLAAFYKSIRSRECDVGRAATDPRLLVALWLYATKSGVGSGRELERLCESHDAYRWLCGGVHVNYHTLNDFRVNNEAALDKLFTQVLSALVQQGIVSVERISQDGTRVRASAGTNSFRGRSSLKNLQRQIKEQIKALKQQMNELPHETSARRQAAQERAARERSTRIEAAMEALTEVQQAKDKQKAKPSKKREARTSTTDPDSRVMKMPGGGYGPGYNLQFATDTQSRAVVGVDATNTGSDVHESEPMRQQVEQRTGLRVTEHLIDGGYVGLESIERAETTGVTVYAPVPKPKKKEVDRYQRRRGDGPGVGAWRQRMGTPAAREIYKQRASTVETVNAEVKGRQKLRLLPVRGLSKVRCIALWAALTYNIAHFAQNLV